MHSSKDSPMASSIECARDDGGSSDPDEWASGDPETAKAMVIYLLDELQPQLWTKRKDAISTFSGYFFRTNPVLSDTDIETLLIGDGQRKGLVQSCGNVSWKSFRLKTSSFRALDLLLDLLDPQKNREAGTFVRVFIRLDECMFRAMKLGKHLNNKNSGPKAMYLINLLQRNNRSVPLDGTDDTDSSTASKSIDMSVPLSRRASIGSVSNSGLLKKLGNFLSRRPPMQALLQKGIVHSPRCFGRPIASVVQTDNVNQIPTFLVRCCEFLREHGIDKVGLFRVSGEQQEVLRIKHMLDYSEHFSFDGANPHSVAGIVKLFVRELPEPLLTFERYEDMVQAARSEDWDKLRELKMSLPEPNLSVLQYLCEFLAEVSLNVAHNKMSSANLAIVFAPNLMRPVVESFEAIAKDTPVTIAAVRFFLDEAKDSVAQANDLAAASIDAREFELNSKLPLPSPWVEYLDEATGAPFFYNPDTGDSCWDRPVASADDSDKDSESASHLTQPAADDALEEALLPSVISVASVADEHVEGDKIAVDSEGKEEQHSAAEVEEAEATLPEGWEQFADELSGEPYFYHKTTGECLWEQPDPSHHVSESQPEPEQDVEAEANADEPLESLVPPETATEADAVAVGGLDSEVTHSVSELEQDSLASMYQKVFEGAWSESESGGCFPDITWFTNPQFLVRVPSTRACRLRFDLSYLSVSSVPIGVHVVHVSSDRTASDGRLLTILSDEELLVIGPFDSDVNAVASVEVLVPEGVDDLYTQVMVIPAMEQPGGEATFRLLMYSDVEFEATQIDDGLGWHHEEVSSAWTAETAGGCYPNFISWRNNPQFRLRIERPSLPLRALVHLRHSQQESADGAIGFYIFRNLGPAAHKLCIAEGDVVMRSEFLTASDVVAEIVLEPFVVPKDSDFEPHYVIVPCTYLPGVLDSFELSVYSERPLQLSAIDASKRWRSTPELSGAWTLRRSGGCRNFETWRQNPTFELVCTKRTRALCVLSQPDSHSILPIGFYVLNRSGRVRGKGLFMVAPEVFCDMQLKPEEGPFVVVPCTFNPGQIGEFVLRVFTEAPITLTVVS